jgi:hypothetical protein
MNSCNQCICILSFMERSEIYNLIGRGQQSISYILLDTCQKIKHSLFIFPGIKYITKRIYHDKFVAKNCIAASDWFKLPPSFPYFEKFSLSYSTLFYTTENRRITIIMSRLWLYFLLLFFLKKKQLFFFKK